MTHARVCTVNRTCAVLHNIAFLLDKPMDDDPLDNDPEGIDCKFKYYLKNFTTPCNLV